MSATILATIAIVVWSASRPLFAFVRSLRDESARTVVLSRYHRTTGV